MKNLSVKKKTVAILLAATAVFALAGVIRRGFRTRKTEYQGGTAMGRGI